MKWINLAERHPGDLTKVYIRHVNGGKQLILSYRYSYGEEGMRVHFVPTHLSPDQTLSFDFNQIEWLDESDPRIEYAELKKHIEELQIKYDGLINSIEEAEDEVKITSIYELQAMEVKRGNISLEKYLEICFPEKFEKGYQIIQAAVGALVVPQDMQWEWAMKVLKGGRDKIGLDDLTLNYLQATDRVDRLEEEVEELKEKIKKPINKKLYNKLENMLETEGGRVKYGDRKYIQTEVDALLAQQYRDTVEKVSFTIESQFASAKGANSIFYEEMGYRLLEDIMNLPIRKP